MGTPGVVATVLMLLGTVFVLVFFKRRRSRWLAAVTLAPLVLIATAVAWTGGHDRKEESGDVQANPTTFGAGGAAGASHAAGTGTPGAGSPAAPAASASGPTANTVAESVVGAKGVTLAAAPEPYTPATLWNRMDGGAEHYSKHGLVRASLATANAAGTEFELQVFDMGTPEKAKALFDGTDRDPASAPLPDGLSGVTWAGGGELVATRFYVRLVASAAEPGPDEAALVKAMLASMAAAAGSEPDPRPTPLPLPVPRPEAEAAPPTLIPVTPNPTAPPAPAPVPESPAGPAEQIGAPAHFTAAYGITKIVNHADVLEAVLPDPISVLALAEALRPAGAERLDAFGWSTADAAALPWGTSLLVARGANARARVVSTATPKRDTLISQLQAFSPTLDIEPRLAGWGGRAFLGPTFVGHFPGGGELVVTTPSDAPAAWKQLVATLPGGKQRSGTQHAIDPVQGDLVATRSGAHVLIAAGFGDEDLASAALAAAIGRLSSLDGDTGGR